MRSPRCGESESLTLLGESHKMTGFDHVSWFMYRSGNPRPMASTNSRHGFEIARFTSVISSSPRAEGLERGGDVRARRCRRIQPFPRLSTFCFAAYLRWNRTSAAIEFRPTLCSGRADHIAEPCCFSAPSRRASIMCRAGHCRGKCCQPRNHATSSFPTICVRQ